MTFGILALGFPVSEDLGGFAAFGGSQSHFLPYLPYLNAFLRWRLASWLWGSLFRRIWGVSQPLGAHSLTFFLIFPIVMHSLGDVWHPGSGVPCFGGFGGFRSLWGLTVSLSSLSSYLNAFLRWRLAFVKTWYQEILHNNLFRIHPHAPKAPGRGSFGASFSAQVFGSTLKVDEFGLSCLFCRSLALLGFGKGQSYRIRNVTSHLNTWEAGRE